MKIFVKNVFQNFSKEELEELKKEIGEKKEKKEEMKSFVKKVFQNFSKGSLC